MWLTANQLKMIQTASLKIIDYTFAYKQAFFDLNKSWIEKRFVLEDVDIKVMSDPEKYILNDGGCILIATYNDQPAGTCVLLNKGSNVYEMSKMTVDESLRGLKIGYQLGVAILERAKELKAQRVELFSNKKGSAAAIKLYYKLGFKEIELDTQAYKRADIKMSIDIK